MIGTILGGKYKLTRVLGQGGMGMVYAAELMSGDDVVAVKVLEEGEFDEGTIRRFQREGRAGAALEHDHIIKVFDTGTDEATGRLFIAMELLEGEDLQALIDRLGPLDMRAAICIVVQALKGLAVAHESGIIHRDIKPSNIFLAREGNGELNVKLLDFGIAKVTADPLQSAQSAGLTSTGNLLGSPLYMSPEQVMSSRDVDVRTDVWSMGSTLYCALMGRAPHGAIDSIGRLLFTICSTPPEPLHAVAPWISRALSNVVQRALVIDKDQRYASAREMLAALEPLLTDGDRLFAQSIVAMSEEAKEKAQRDAAASVEFATTEAATSRSVETTATQGTSEANDHPSEFDTSARKKDRRRPAIWTMAVLGGASVLAVIVGIVTYGVRPQSPTTNPLPTSAESTHPPVVDMKSSDFPRARIEIDSPQTDKPIPIGSSSTITTQTSAAPRALARPVTTTVPQTTKSPATATTTPATKKPPSTDGIERSVE